jgi:hypothetical protein
MAHGEWNPDNGRQCCLGAPGPDFHHTTIPTTPAIDFAEQFIYSGTNKDKGPFFCKIAEGRYYYLWEILDQYFREQWNRFRGVK